MLPAPILALAPVGPALAVAAGWLVPALVGLVRRQFDTRGRVETGELAHACQVAALVVKPADAPPSRLRPEATVPGALFAVGRVRAGLPSRAHPSSMLPGSLDGAPKLCSLAPVDPARAVAAGWRELALRPLCRAGLPSVVREVTAEAPRTDYDRVPAVGRLGVVAGDFTPETHEVVDTALVFFVWQDCSQPLVLHEPAEHLEATDPSWAVENRPAEQLPRRPTSERGGRRWLRGAGAIRWKHPPRPVANLAPVRLELAQDLGALLFLALDEALEPGGAAVVWQPTAPAASTVAAIAPAASAVLDVFVSVPPPGEGTPAGRGAAPSGFDAGGRSPREAAEPSLACSLQTPVTNSCSPASPVRTPRALASAAMNLPWLFSHSA